MIPTYGPVQTPSASALVLSTRSSPPGTTRRNPFRSGSMEIFPRSSAPFVTDSLSDPAIVSSGLAMRSSRHQAGSPGQPGRNEHGYARERGPRVSQADGPARDLAAPALARLSMR
jgi:hypothetical protein